MIVKARVLPLLCLFAVALAAPLLAAAQDEFPVPPGTAPTIDGTIASGEWEDAASIELDEDSTLYLKYANECLFLAVRGTTMGIPSPMIIRGEDVVVLHASAALGTAVYTRHGDAWVQTQSFVWRCRDRGFGEAAVAEREAFFEQEGWLGTIGYLGARTESEVQVLLDGPTLRMLLLYMEATRPAKVLSWPAPPEETAHYLPLITGPIPTEIDIDFDQWAILRFE